MSTGPDRQIGWAIVTALYLGGFIQFIAGGTYFVAYINGDLSQTHLQRIGIAGFVLSINMFINGLMDTLAAVWIHRSLRATCQ